MRELKARWVLYLTLPYEASRGLSAIAELLVSSRGVKKNSVVTYVIDDVTALESEFCTRAWSQQDSPMTGRNYLSVRMNYLVNE